MKNIATILVLAATLFAACSPSQKRFDRKLTEAMELLHSGGDSALLAIADIDPSELEEDSLKAKYHYIKAYTHLRQNRSMVQDSLTGFVHRFYRGKDMDLGIRSGVLYAWYRFWTGNTPGAIRMLDSLISLEGVPDSLLVLPLRTRTLLGAVQYEGQRNSELARRLMDMETDPRRKTEAKYMLCESYEYAGQIDSALILIEEIIEFAKANRLATKQFEFEFERAQILTESGRYEDSDKAIDDIFRKAPENTAAHYLHLQKAMNALNAGNPGISQAELALAEKTAEESNAADDAYFNSFKALVATVADYRKDGRLTLSHIAAINNRQQEHFNRMKASQWESERSAMRLETQSSALKAESRQKTVIILIVLFAAFGVAVASAWLLRTRRNRMIEQEERAEALQKMVDELRTAPAGTGDTLRRAMLRQIGIVKMVAATPTEQNREILRRISAKENENGDISLVNWADIYESVDVLYGNFHSRLHSAFGAVLSDKEEQIIVLMVAGFSTKEIAVITSQSTATIYVRKSAVRRKLGIAEKEDILSWLSAALEPANAD